MKNIFNYLGECNERGRTFLVFLLGFITHAFMIFVPGAWWDDYKWYVCSMNDIKAHMISAGRLDAFLMIGAVNWLPVWLFRIIVVSCFCVSAVLIYKILCIITDDISLSISIAILYNLIPVNDIRIMKCVYPYTLTLLMFWMAFLFLLQTIYCRRNSKIVYRGCSLVLFFLSFSTSSLVFFYVIPMLTLGTSIYLKLKKSGKCDISTFLTNFISYADFFVIPIVFWIFKIKFLHPYAEGLYSDYNELTIYKCISAIRIVPKAALSMFKAVLANWFYVFDRHIWLLVVEVVIAVTAIFISIKKQEWKNTKRADSIREGIVCLVVGSIIVLIGLYPYVCIRQGEIGTVGISGRDAVLTPLGFSLMIYSLTKIMTLPRCVRESVLIMLLVLSSVHFTDYYQKYLVEHYNHMALEQCWSNDENIKNGTTFLYFRGGEALIGDSFYALNAMSIETFKDSKRFFASGLGSMSYIDYYEKKQLMHDDAVYGYSQYDLNDITIDGIIFASYKLTPKKALVLRIEEIFNKDNYVKKLNDTIDYSYVILSESEANEIYQAYIDGNIKDANGVREFLEQ